MLVEILNEKINTKITPFNKKIENFEFEFFMVEEVTFEDEYPRKEAIENLLGAFRDESVNFLYLIVGEKERVSFYFGVARNLDKNLNIDIDDIASYFLKSNLLANFRGSKIKRVSKSEKNKIKKIFDFKYINRVDGIIDENETSKKFQGIDRLVDAMSKDEFALLVIANPLEEIEEIEKSLYKIYDKIAPFVKKTIQKNKSKSKQENISVNESESSVTSTINSTTENTSNISSSTETNNNKSASKQKTSSTSITNSKNSSNSISKSNISSHLNLESESEVVNIEFEKKEYEEVLKYIDEVLLKRCHYIKGKGGFKSGIYLFANEKGKIYKLSNIFLSLFNRVEFNKSPLKITKIKEKSYLSGEFNYIKNFQLPTYDIKGDENEKLKSIFYSKIDGNIFLSSKELSVVTSLPQREVIGLSLKEEVEFGLNVKSKGEILLGKLIKDGNETEESIYLSRDDINKHIFITGVTGSGKTTTCHKILFSSNMPFLVIEPAKKEYRVLAKNEDVIVFTFGDNLAPFKLNPFELFEGESISSRVDMIKAVIESSFDLEAAMPQIIERAIYKSYEKYGWDISSNINLEYDEPYLEGVFPTLEDVIENVESIVIEENFDERLKNDYIASINARLKALLVGSKGDILNCKKGFDIFEILNKKVIIELEEIKNPSEKAFFMGILLLNINEALKRIHKKNRNFKHITLIEEAHRLLSRYEVGDSLNKKQAIEVFTDMLAEVRKYGEGLIIVDQIPNKLTPEILKNTNTKIVHRIFANDDKEVIGNAIALKRDQKEYLSYLEVGRAIMFSQSFQKAIAVKIEPIELSTTKDEISDEEIRKKYLSFYKRVHNIDLEDGILDKILEIKFLWDSFCKSDKKRSEKILYKIQKLINKLDLDVEVVAEFLSRDSKFDKEKIKRYIRS